MHARKNHNLNALWWRWLSVTNTKLSCISHNLVGRQSRYVTMRGQEFDWPRSCSNNPVELHGVLRPETTQPSSLLPSPRSLPCSVVNCNSQASSKDQGCPAFRSSSPRADPSLTLLPNPIGFAFLHWCEECCCQLWKLGASASSGRAGPRFCAFCSCTIYSWFSFLDPRFWAFCSWIIVFSVPVPGVVFWYKQWEPWKCWECWECRETWPSCSQLLLEVRQSRFEKETRFQF